MQDIGPFNNIEHGPPEMVLPQTVNYMRAMLKKPKGGSEASPRKKTRRERVYKDIPMLINPLLDVTPTALRCVVICVMFFSGEHGDRVPVIRTIITSSRLPF